MFAHRYCGLHAVEPFVIAFDCAGHFAIGSFAIFLNLIFFRNEMYTNVPKICINQMIGALCQWAELNV